MIARLLATTRIGLALILIGIAWFGGWACWEATRIWVPLNVPISLSRGHTRTPEFKINVEGTYEIRIVVSRGFDFWSVPCLIGFNLCDGNPAPLQVAWSLSHGGRVLANGTSHGDQEAIWGTDTMGRRLGVFRAGKGGFVLDLDVLQDTSRLNGGAPRLVVFEAGYERADANDMGVSIFLLSLLLAASGTYLSIRPVLARRRKKMAALARSYSLTQLGPQPRDLRMDRELPASPIARTGFRPPASACVGAVLILAGLAACASIQHWIATRNSVAVDMPVSLAPGHLRTGPFRTDVGEDYTILIDTDQNDPRHATCADSSALKTRWLLYRDGQVANGDDQTFGGLVGGFYGERGVYDLDVEVLKDAGCLNSAHPRLRVVALTNSYAGITSLLLWLCTVGVGTGGILLAIGGVERFRKPPPPVAHCEPEGTAGGHFRWKRRPLKARPLFAMSYYGLIATITYLPLFIFLVLHSSVRLVPNGLRIHLVRPGINAQRNPGIQPLLVRVESGGGTWRASLYVGSRPVSWEDFGVVLQKELNQRPPHWPVYLVGDPNMDWQWAVKAIDIIRGLQAEVVLLTSAPASPHERMGNRSPENGPE